MATYLYCLLAAGADPARGLSGVAQAPVRAVKAGALAAWVSDVAEPAMVRPTLDDARAHDAVVRAAMRQDTPVPARFGQFFEGDEALRTALAGREEELLRTLARVSGAVEMTVRVLIAGEESSTVATAAATGTDYLAAVVARNRADAQRRQQAEFLQRRIAEAVRGVAREEVSTAPSGSARSVEVCHLVRREDIARYREALRELMRQEPSWRVMVSGPWPPYSFSEALGE